MIRSLADKVARRHRGFTLIELLAVMVIISILLALVVPAIIGPLGATSLTSAAAKLAGDLQFARQEAITRNLSVEIHFYSDGSAVRHYATYRLAEDGSREAISPMVTLPEGIVISEDSTLTQIGSPAPPEAESLPDSFPADTLTYSFHFLPDGSSDLDLSEKWYLTIVGENTDEVPPPNFATVQVDPLTGIVRVHRPS